MKRCATWCEPCDGDEGAFQNPSASWWISTAAREDLFRCSDLDSSLSTLVDDGAQIVLQDYIDAGTDAERRVDRVTGQITEHLPGWSMAPVATAIQAMRGVALTNAVTIVAEVGDFSWFGNPRS